MTRRLPRRAPAETDRDLRARAPIDIDENIWPTNRLRFKKKDKQKLQDVVVALLQMNFLDSSQRPLSAPYLAGPTGMPARDLRNSLITL